MTLRHAAAVFFRFPSPRLIVVLTLAAGAVRAAFGPLATGDAIIIAVIPLYWALQEWILHKIVLHLEPFKVGPLRVDPYFARKHREHHANPWSLPETFLPLRVVLVAMLVNICLWYLLMPTAALAWTGITGISAMSLVYEWIHYLTHTPYRPRSRYYGNICLSHRRHHFKNEHYWFGFVIPWVDSLFRTNPDWRTVETSPTCRTLGISDEPPAEIP
ncbi:MAG TPA: sterol desaturase family protein [bacterium]|nr:sterol desaturase family protein [bacterium]